MQRLWPLQDGRFSKSSYVFNVWYFFGRFLAKNIFNKVEQSILTCFRQFKFLAQIEYFGKAIAHAKVIAFPRWPIFKIVSFLEYLVVFRAVFCIE